MSKVSLTTLILGAFMYQQPQTCYLLVAVKLSSGISFLAKLQPQTWNCVKNDSIAGFFL